MWKPIETTEYSLNVCRHDSVELYVTDFVNIWYVTLSEEKLIEELKETNSILEMADLEFLDKGMEMLSEPKNYHNLDITIQDSKLLLTLVKRFPFKLKLQLTLIKGTNELFFTKVTQLLLRTIDDLKSSQLELRQLLNKKDKEIDEYKCEGGEIALRHLKTVKFNEEGHLNKHRMYEENFGLTSLPESLLTKTFSCPETEKTLVMKNEPLTPNVEIKAEPESQNGIKLNSTDMKQEEIKSEPTVWSSPKKKMKRLNL